MCLRDRNAFQPSFMYSQQAHLSPDSRIGYPGAPIPAEHAVPLPQPRQALHGIHTPDNRLFFIGAGNEFRRGIKNRSERIFFFKKGFYRKLPYPVHVVGFSQIHLIQPDIRQGIDSVKPQKDLVLFPDFRLRRKIHPVLIIMGDDLQGLILIIPVIGIFHLPVGHQVRINAAGNDGRKEFPRPVLPHPPAVIQFLFSHANNPLSLVTSGPKNRRAAGRISVFSAFSYCLRRPA